MLALLLVDMTTCPLGGELYLDPLLVVLAEELRARCCLLSPPPPLPEEHAPSVDPLPLRFVGATCVGLPRDVYSELDCYVARAALLMPVGFHSSPPVADDLAWNLEFMNEVRFDHFGPRDDSESDSDDGPGHDYVVNDPRLIIHS